MEISLVEFLRLVISPSFGSKIAGSRIDQYFVTSHLSRRANLHHINPLSALAALIAHAQAGNFQFSPKGI